MQYNNIMKRVDIFLLGILVLGILLRYGNLSPFTVYPDSYQNLIVAENIKTYGSVVGFLGKNGMLYPDFFMWTRPVFPLLINIVSFFGVSSLIAAQAIAFMLGILAIPVAFLFGKEVFKNSHPGDDQREDVRILADSQKTNAIKNNDEYTRYSLIAA